MILKDIMHFHYFTLAVKPRPWDSRNLNVSGKYQMYMYAHTRVRARTRTLECFHLKYLHAILTYHQRYTFDYNVSDTFQ